MTRLSVLSVVLTGVLTVSVQAQIGQWTTAPASTPGLVRVSQTVVTAPMPSAPAQNATVVNAPAVSAPATVSNGDCNGEAKECKDDCSWCKLGDKFDLGETLFGKDCNFDIGGWANGGYHTRSDGFWNDQPDRVNLHQAAVFAEKRLDTKDGFDWGFRVNFIYGIDGVNTQAFGSRPGTWDYLNGWGDGNREAWALPEAYATVGYKDFSLKLGKFFTIIGYEVVPSVGNFFYSHAFTFNFSEPFTHTGALATYKVGEKLTTQFGWVAGNDTGYQINDGGTAFLGGFTYAATDKITFGYALNVGDLGATGNGMHHTALLTVKPTDKIEWVLQNDVCKHDNTNRTSFNSTAVVNYLFYTVNDCLKLGSRAEWYKVQGTSYYEVTAGINFTPQANVRIRPEYRYQWAEGSANPLNLPVSTGIFGVDVVLVF